MPRRRKRTTNRKRQDERRLRVQAVRRDEPDPKKLARAFIGLALARAEAEARAQAEAAVQQEAGREAEKAGDSSDGPA